MRALLIAGMLCGLALPALAGHALTPDQARAQAAAGALTIVDIRLPMEWAATGLPADAKGVSLQDPASLAVRPGFVDDLLRAVGDDRNAPIALICARGNRSALALQLLARRGFTNVHDISEGMVGGPNGPGWLARDLPIEPCRVC